MLLDRIGKIQFITGPTAPFDARLRRAQSLALVNGTALKIAKQLIEAKLQSQETFVREKLSVTSSADLIAGLRDRLRNVETMEALRVVEAHAALTLVRGEMCQSFGLRRTSAKYQLTGSMLEADIRP